jgi:hypothetical protein
MDSNERAKGCEGGERAMLGVSPAPVGWIEVGDSGGWSGFPAAMVKELVERGQPGATPGKDGQEEDCVNPLSDGALHGKSLPQRAGSVHSSRRAPAQKNAGRGEPQSPEDRTIG